jgi:hypothetical protein
VTYDPCLAAHRPDHHRLRSLAWWGDELVDSLGGWRISLDVTPHDPITAIVT